VERDGGGAGAERIFLSMQKQKRSGGKVGGAEHGQRTSEDMCIGWYRGRV
jgi:hypothetical protein